MEEFRVIIAGTRDFSNYELLKEKCDNILSTKRQDSNIVILSGTAKGADRLGERYARERGFLLRRFPADWDKDGNKAGPIRNAKMADNADALIAFWNGTSRGTAHMIMTAKEKGLATRVINYKTAIKMNENKKIEQLQQLDKALNAVAANKTVHEVVDRGEHLLREWVMYALKHDDRHWHDNGDGTFKSMETGVVIDTNREQWLADFENEVKKTGYTPSWELDMYALEDSEDEHLQDPKYQAAQQAIVDRVMDYGAKSFTPEQIGTLERVVADCENESQREHTYERLWTETEPRLTNAMKEWKDDAYEELRDLAHGIARSDNQGLKR